MTTPAVRFVVGGRDTRKTLGRPYTVVYDGDCRVCTRLAALLRRWDSRRDFEVVPSQTQGVMARFPWIPAGAFAESLQMIAPDGRTWAGAEAIERIFDVLPRGGLFAVVFRLPLVRGIADRAYRSFARNRHRFGCSDHCAANSSRKWPILWS